MRIAADVLARYVDLPAEPRALRELLDDTGLEVKRSEHDGTSTVYTLELLANRGDHHCYEGVARELSGRLGGAVRLPEVADLEVGPSPHPLRLQTELCLVYTATLLERGDGGPLPAEALRVLEGAGIHSLSAPVDATNLANLELGQPTHAFDADTLVGPVSIRLSRPGETALPLFETERVELPEGTLVITDDEKILAIAGVIGCEESKTTERTTRLLLESATFDPVAVRKASRALGIHTDSSARFERGADPARPLVGAGRVVRLLEQAGWRRAGTAGVVGDWQDPERRIPLSVEATNAFLATALTGEEMAERLARYGFDVAITDDGFLDVRVPPHRLWDVEHAADLYEELAKSVGYNATPEALPPVDLGALPSPVEARRSRVDEVLTGMGFYEVLTDGFYSRALLEQLELPEDHPLQAHVETLNALERGYSLLKNNALAQAIEAVAVNERMRTLDVKAFEWTRTFHPVDEPLPEVPDPRRSPCTERALLWAACAGRDRPRAWDDAGRAADVYLLKGLVEELGVELGLALEVGAPDPSHPLHGLLHPGRQAAVRLDGATIGVLGEVHPRLRKSFKLKHTRPCYLELDAAPLLSEGRRPSYEEPPSTQPIERSLAFTLPQGVEAGAIATTLREAGPDWLEQVRVVDRFAHDEDGAPVRTITYRLVFANTEQGRSTDDVNAASEALVEAVAGRWSDRGVKLR